MSEHANPSREISAARKTVYSFISVLIFFVCVELICRFFVDVPRFHVLFGAYSGLEAFSAREMLPGLRLTIAANDTFEFRGEVTTSQKTEPLEFRIFTIGGSVAWGQGASSLEATYFREFERKLNSNKKNNRRYQVLSAGAHGHVSANELVTLNMGLFEFSPDLIIVYDGYNDLFHDVGPNHHTGSPFFFDDLYQTMNSSSSQIAFLRLAKRSAFFTIFTDMFYEQAVIKKIIKMRVDPDYSKNLVRIYKNNLEGMALLTKLNNVKIAFAFQATLGDKATLSKLETDHLQKKDASMEYSRLNKIVYNQLAETMQTVAAENDILFSDFRNVFDGTKETVYVDYAHNNDYGQKIMGEALFERFSAYIYNIS